MLPDERLRIVIISMLVSVWSGCGGKEQAAPPLEETEPQVEEVEAESLATGAIEGAQDDLAKPGIEKSRGQEPATASEPDGEVSPKSEQISFSAHGRYLIQVAAYQDRARAERLAGDLRLMGYPSGVVPGEGIYRVRIGFFEEVSEAEVLGERLKKELGLSFWVDKR